MHEWPLVIFTLLMQVSVGCLAVALLCHLRTGGTLRPTHALAAMRLPLLSAFIAGALGLLASIFHLGNPLHMFYTLTHIASSWMSREVLVTGIYMGLLFISVALAMLKQRLAVGILMLALLAGLVDIYVMSAIYANTLFTLWGGWFTWSGFYGSALLLGGMLTCTMVMPVLKTQGYQTEAGRVLRISLAACGAGILLLLLSASSLLTMVGQPASLGITGKTLPEGLFNLSILRVALLSLGMFTAGRLLCRNSHQRSAGAVLGLSSLCIVAAEVVGRYVFFSLGA
ncbi:dimethyl sulfoxide reductase anchor subunit family protein [Entomohabitans teleogrylli]|uniref:dimethyl sulfoxide reductase anchor subunit family protein n=1 Tax=Entomohabitans teleogrylli TaxID=1384589 RepID=UPI00073D5E68|nr:DmsC/YnfH family molybdoenzyme membrane anchor subunit [Entomohabitans teleogrylli]